MAGCQAGACAAGHVTAACFSSYGPGILDTAQAGVHARSTRRTWALPPPYLMAALAAPVAMVDLLLSLDVMSSCCTIYMPSTLNILSSAEYMPASWPCPTLPTFTPQPPPSALFCSPRPDSTALRADPGQPGASAGGGRQLEWGCCSPPAGDRSLGPAHAPRNTGLPGTGPLQQRD